MTARIVASARKKKGVGVDDIRLQRLLPTQPILEAEADAYTTDEHFLRIDFKERAHWIALDGGIF